MRYRIEVRQRRGEHGNVYTQHERVKPGKVQRLIDQTACDIARHEARHREWIHWDWHADSDDDFDPVTLTIPELDLEFHVSAVPVGER